jgi:hypothetical protein
MIKPKNINTCLLLLLFLYFPHTNIVKACLEQPHKSIFLITCLEPNLTLFKMRCDTLSVIAFAVAAAGAALGPSEPKFQQSFSIDEAKAYCPSGDVACCQNTEVIKADGVLGNLLAKGALNNLLGVGDSSCAKSSLIENLNLLGMFHQFYSY